MVRLHCGSPRERLALALLGRRTADEAVLRRGTAATTRVGGGRAIRVRRRGVAVEHRCIVAGAGTRRLELVGASSVLHTFEDTHVTLVPREKRGTTGINICTLP